MVNGWHITIQETADLAVAVAEDSHQILAILGPSLQHLSMKAVGSSPIFAFLSKLLQSIDAPPVLVCGELDLRSTLKDIHSLPLEVCVLIVLYTLLDELAPSSINEAISSLTGNSGACINVASCLRDVNGVS